MNYSSCTELSAELKTQIFDFLLDCGKQDQLYNEMYLGSEYNYYPDMHTFYIARDGENVTGFLMIYADTPECAELSACVLPRLRRQGIFTELFRLAQQELKKFRYSTIQLKIEKAFSDREELLAHYPVHYLHSEYVMIWKNCQSLPTVPADGFCLRPAVREDLPALAKIESESFGDPPDVSETYVTAAFEGEKSLLYTALLNETPIGCVSVDRAGRYQYLFALCIASSYRRQGFGRKLLCSVLPMLTADSRREITIGVDRENLAALPLYRSCGFTELTEIQYYEMNL